MNDWVSEEAEKLRLKVEHANTEVEKARFKRDALQRLAPPLFQSLREAVTRDIALFNTHFSGVEQRLKPLENIGESEFRVDRPYPPSYVLQVRFHLEVPSIRYSIQLPEPVGHKLAWSSDIFHISLNTECNGVYLTHGSEVITADQASQRLLGPAIQIMSPE